MNSSPNDDISQEFDLSRASALWDEVMCARRIYEAHPNSIIARNNVLKKLDAFGAVFLGKSSDKVSYLLPGYLLSLDAHKGGPQTLS